MLKNPLARGKVMRAFVSEFPRAQHLVKVALFGLLLLFSARTAGGQSVVVDPTADTYIWHSDACGAAGDNYPCGETVSVDNPILSVKTWEDCGRATRALVRFDLDFVTVEVTSAKLRLYALQQHEYATNVFHAARLMEDWAASDVTWCESDAGIEWCSLGACFGTLHEATTIIESKFPAIEDDPAGPRPYEEWIEWDVTEIVNRWIAGTWANYGLCVYQTPLFGHNREQAIYFASLENADPSLAPRLLMIDDAVAVGPKECDAGWRVRVSPNPVMGVEPVQLTTGMRGSYEIQLFDVMGRLVRRVAQQPDGSGVHHWDQRDETGRLVDGGLYFFVVRNSESVQSGKVAVIR